MKETKFAKNETDLFFLFNNRKTAAFPSFKINQCRTESPAFDLVNCLFFDESQMGFSADF